LGASSQKKKMGMPRKFLTLLCERPETGHKFELKKIDHETELGSLCDDIRHALNVSASEKVILYSGTDNRHLNNSKAKMCDLLDDPKKRVVHIKVILQPVKFNYGGDNDKRSTKEYLKQSRERAIKFAEGIRDKDQKLSPMRFENPSFLDFWFSDLSDR